MKYSPDYIPDFCCTYTWPTIKEELLPVLEKLARQEFGVCVLNGTYPEADSLIDVSNSRKQIETIVKCYLRRLEKMHTRFAVDYAMLIECEDGSELDNFIDVVDELG